MAVPKNSTRDAQAAVSLAVRDLRQVDANLTKIRESLPVTAVATAELRGVLKAVQTDLLADAIETLTLVAGSGR